MAILNLFLKKGNRLKFGTGPFCSGFKRGPWDFQIGDFDPFSNRHLHYKIESFKLAPENIFFLSIGAFDQLLGHCENSVDKIIEILSGFVKSKADISTKRFVFEHYLQDQKGFTGDQTLSDTFKAYHKELLKEYFNRDI